MGSYLSGEIHWKQKLLYMYTLLTINGLPIIWHDYTILLENAPQTGAKMTS